MEYKDYIKAGNKVLHVPYEHSWWCGYKPEVVTIGEYRPYYTDGEMADPSPDEYEGCCQVEVCDTRYDERQIRLDRLFPIEQKEDKVLYDGKVYEVYGYAQGCSVFECYADEDDMTAYCILKEGDELRVVDEDDVCSPRTIEDLSHDELMTLWGDIVRGSNYTDDYRNSVDVPDDEACDIYEDFWCYLVDEYGEDNAAGHDTAKEFADYFHCQLAA